MFSGNTDCYQPIERKLKITRRTLEVCLTHRNPVFIITKSSLIQRDIDILKLMAEHNLVSVNLSITTLNPALSLKMEPRCSTPQKRLETISLLADNKIPVGINVSPVIPGLTDEEIPAILKTAVEHGAESASWIMLRLPYSVKDLFIDWIRKEFPDRADKIIHKIKEIRGGKLNDSEIGRRFKGEGNTAQAISDLFQLNCRKYNLNLKKLKLDTSNFIHAVNHQLNLFG